MGIGKIFYAKRYSSTNVTRERNDDERHESGAASRDRRRALEAFRVLCAAGFATSSLENECPILACIDDRNEEHRFGPERI
jgi:hypothetical protein